MELATEEQLAEWCEANLDSPSIVGELFASTRISQVRGLRLQDDRLVVVRAYRAAPRIQGVSTCSA